MITRATVVLCTLVLAATGTSQQQPDKLPSGADLLDEMEKRDQEKAKIDKIRSVTSKGECSLIIMGQGEPSTGPYEEFIQDGKSYMSADYGNFLLQEGSDGTTFWQIDPMSGVTIKEGDDAAIDRRLLGLTLGDSWRDHYKAAKCIGSRPIGGKTCWILSMKAKQGKNDTWYVEAKTKRLVGVDIYKYSPGGSSEVEVRFSDFREVDGIPYPFTAEIHVEQADVSVHLDSVEHNVEIPASRFALPPEVAKAMRGRKQQKPAEELKVRLLEIRKQHVVSMRVKTDMEKVGNALALAIPEVHRFLEESGGQMLGPPFTRYHSMDGPKLDIEVGFPVAKPIKGKGRIIASELPGGEVAEVWHIGPYEKLGETYSRLAEWFANNKEVEAGDARWEVYWTDPGREPDPTKWRTQIRWTVK